MTAEQKKIVKLLKSGDFTILYHDNGYCRIYKGKSDYSTAKGDGVDFPDDGFGYIPCEVSLLVEALGGNVDSV